MKYPIGILRGQARAVRRYGHRRFGEGVDGKARAPSGHEHGEVRRTGIAAAGSRPSSAAMGKALWGRVWRPNALGTFQQLNTLDRLEFRNYWFETGTPTFLVEVLKKNHYQLDNVTEYPMLAEDLRDIDIASGLLYVCGYLTILFKSFKIRFVRVQI